jgi:hypothetical protein
VNALGQLDDHDLRVTWNGPFWCLHLVEGAGRRSPAIFNGGGGMEIPRSGISEYRNYGD